MDYNTSFFLTRSIYVLILKKKGMQNCKFSVKINFSLIIIILPTLRSELQRLQTNLTFHVPSFKLA